MLNNLQKNEKNLLLLKLKTLKIPKLAFSQIASFVKKKMGQMTASSYKLNITIVIKLVI